MPLAFCNNTPTAPILVIDDEIQILNMLKIALTRKGFLVEAKKNIRPWITFKDFLLYLLEEWEKERKNEKDLISTSDLAKTLWGGEEDQTPYVYLERGAPQIVISEAFEGYFAEYQDAVVWKIMDAMLQKMTYSELQDLDIGEVIDRFDGAIHYDERADLDIGINLTCSFE